MKLGVFSPALASLSLEDALKYLKKNNVQAMELGCGGYPGTAHCNAKEIVKDKKKAKELKDLFDKYGIEISALSVHGNPVHPDKAFADNSHSDFLSACELGGMIGVNRIVTFSGCPGSDKNATAPNWVTCAWPDDFIKILEYQWNDVLIPYFQNAVKEANSRGIDYICLEMHPGFCVHNTETLLKLRTAVGNAIGANFDPSHLVWQGIDPCRSLLALKDAVYHFHAKDVRIDKFNTAVNGVLDTKSYLNELERSWVFRTVGYGHDELFWRDIISTLSLIGYDHVVSIEHEDSFMQPFEGLEKAISFLNGLLIKEKKPTTAWWA